MSANWSGKIPDGQTGKGSPQVVIVPVLFISIRKDEYDGR
jgi:hypothetical protein